MTKNYTLNYFDFELPKELIAQEPAHPRDHARLLVYDRKTKSITDDSFYNLEKYLDPSTTLVLNNSKVEKCRIQIGKVELFVIDTINPHLIKAMVRPGKKFKLGRHRIEDIDIEVIDIADDGIRTIKLEQSLDDEVFEKYKLTPLPPYIEQNEELSEEYQTVYAKPLGSKAAPTAGLHFTDELLEKIKSKHDILEVTLHVGLGTFAPVKQENLKEHKLHEESYFISSDVAKKLNEAKHLTAVGTTSVRTLESAPHPFSKTEDSTTIFITPGYEFQSVDALITNFHLPKSTLLMLVSAFIGSVDELHRIYAHAIRKGYRFYSFGDAMIII